MIEMIKSNAISFILKIDIRGIEELCIYIKELNNKSKRCPQILYVEEKKILK